MIPHNKPTLGIEEELAARRVLQSGWLAQGTEVESFENEFCQFIGLPKGHAVAVTNGTSALFLALNVLNARKKKVIFPGYVCSALRHAVGMVGGTECLVDVAPNSPNIDLTKLEESGSDINIVPHMYGIPVELTNFSSENIIEDCAQAIGAKVNNINVGLQGSVGIFSFYVTKLMTSGGQGGMLISKDKSLVESVRDYREFDNRHDDKKRFNFQMTDLQAAIGREQLKKLPKFLSRREEIFNEYKKVGLDLLDVPNNNTNLVPVRYRAVVVTKNPEKIIESLKLVGVTAVIPTEERTLLDNSSILPNAIQLTRETVSLPIYPSLSDEEVDLILSVITNK